MKTKVYGGTPKGGRSLCYKCRYSHVIRSLNLQEVIRCDFVENRDITFNVVECSKFNPKDQPDVHQMEKIAWVVETRNRGPWGFGGEKKSEIVIRRPGEQAEPAVPYDDPIE